MLLWYKVPPYIWKSSRQGGQFCWLPTQNLFNLFQVLIMTSLNLRGQFITNTALHIWYFDSIMVSCTSLKFSASLICCRQTNCCGFMIFESLLWVDDAHYWQRIQSWQVNTTTIIWCHHTSRPAWACRYTIFYFSNWSLRLTRFNYVT